LTDDTGGPSRGARTETRTVTPAARTRTNAEGTITPRERQVCALVADGLTNKEIAARLVLSQRTVESRVQNVLNKTGFANRELIATWVKQRTPSAHREHASGTRDGG
jgi:DNA-binding NarL/FixJ family response regulator